MDSLISNFNYMYKIHYSNITLENMIGGNKPPIKSLKGLNLFPKGSLESKLLNPTNGYEWSINAFRNYFFLEMITVLLPN